MPKGIRPTQGKVRKAIFDILGDLEGLSFLELFAGSGAVGFEAASRGISGLTLVEDSRDALKEIRENMEALNLTSCNLYPFEAEKAIQAFYRDKRKFDIIFLDPPYYKGIAPRHSTLKKIAGSSGSREEIGESLTKKTLQMLGGYDILAPNGFVVAQHFKKDELPGQSGGLELIKRSRYGDTLLSLYKKKI